MAISTTQSIWRSGGGDQTRTAYCGTGLMVAEFYISGASAAGTSAKVSSASGAPAVVLPIGAVVVQINALCAATGGTTPTFDMGWTGYSDTSATDNTGLVSAAVATTGKLVIDFASATAGNDLNTVMSSTQMVTITGGGTSGDAPTGGSITGQILYYVTDPLLGQQNV
jgi:hypothetical protein